ncbi:dynein regulatory complex protein 9-like [Pollicipes pollicipes]|uniref:dynein regulatory complex protein 9-like n=1 Tax=Pollicipes pollicipes TaxID=41117 RepID=UPI001884B21F|nr:dynein regulatory complex protein 9-like [Pollicipes pollicipes]
MPKKISETGYNSPSSVPSTQGGQASWSRNLSIAPSGDEYDEKDDPQLVENNMVSEVDAQVIYALFDEYSGQLEVLGKVIAAPYIKDHVDETETLRQRFRRQEDEPLKIRGTHGENMVPASPHLMKIQADRAYLSKAIERVMKALRRESSHLPLLETVEAEGARRQEFVVIEEDAIANSKSITALQEEIRELKVSMTKEITDRDNRIYELRDELQEVLARTGMEVRYTAASSRARLASNEGQTEQKRLLKRNQAEGARVECDYETRVNTEIESHLRDALDELDDMLDKRLTKFDVDTDTKERELSSLKYQKQQNFQALCDVKEKYANYTRVIAEDDEELRLEEERIKEEERREAAAIVIQSYWKGYKERKKLKKKLRKLRRAAKKAKKAGKARNSQ